MSENTETQLELFALPEISRPREAAPMQKEFKPVPGFDRPGIHFVALGGAEKVGMNMYAYIVDNRIIVVDAGYDFLNDDFPVWNWGLPTLRFLKIIGKT